MRQTLSVPEVSCEHCKSTIEGALAPLAGVTSASVEIEAKNVDVEFDPDVVQLDALVAAIEEVGYDVAR